MTSTTSSQPPSHSSSVRTYYEQNSAWFRLVGRRQHSQAIHRPVWAAGISDREAALNHVNDCIGKQVQTFVTRQPDARVRLVDLGCGFGGTIQYLVRRFGPAVWAAGVTISSQQAQVGQQWVNALDAQTQGAFVEADFHAVPLTTGMDVAYSVEAFAHAGEPERYFTEVTRLLKPGGRLILCDDFRVDRRPGHALTDADRRWLAIFQAGWHVPHLLSPAQVTALAARHQLHKVEEIDFSPDLRMRSFPDALLPLFTQAVQPNGRFSALVGSIVGGWALEHAIRRGTVTYRFLVFEKQA